MARNRQQAKQRQAERRARRLEEQAAGAPEGGDGSDGSDGQGRSTEVPPVEDPRAVEPAPGIDPNLAVGAPPQDEGRSDTVIEDEPELEVEDEELAEAEAELADDYAPRGRRGADEAAAKDRPRLVQFLIAVWAELQRVQWPKRQALTTLTGVVLGFVLIAGGYLGLLDAIFNRLVQAIL
jgi:preprotein translocase SecE subunit